VEGKKSQGPRVSLAVIPRKLKVIEIWKHHSKILVDAIYLYNYTKTKLFKIYITIFEEK
jgi:hypothetical protein